MKQFTVRLFTLIAVGVVASSFSTSGRADEEASRFMESQSRRDIETGS